MSIKTAFKPLTDLLRKPVSVLKQLLGQGCSPGCLALGVAVGATIGLAPLVWGTSLLCAALAWRLKLNQLAVQVGNYACYPLQIALFVPFLLAGQKLFLLSAQASSLEAWRVALVTDPLLFLRNFWLANLYALVIWLLLAPLFFYGFFLPLRALLLRWKSTFISLQNTP
ncbi:hypothetical protein A7E78_13045 [Syntrophotalea acetylenivorans]|uniref:DUF2062 domain-containing protein n=1 Tax=Syntrophotalea acetylenivorans TaxID=1842532 RepID=A0A1L3GRX3_9BACT|nr:DUF2062 domain-containing protein [Syntrophotalea acetylenivorans]APG28677.1 hypothetical protein A7E78_13045 [Syntrophotalea acetylenivorans]